MAGGATKMALAYAKDRKTFQKPIVEHQAIQLKLAEMSSPFVDGLRVTSRQVESPRLPRTLGCSPHPGSLGSCRR